jgi:hypothetical protein
VAKPFIQRFTGLELWDLQKTATHCDACLTGSSKKEDHREMPNPCKFVVRLEIVRRLNHYDQCLETLEQIANLRKFV